MKNDPRFDVELRAFLPRAYNFKAMADYQTGPGSQVSARARGRQPRWHADLSNASLVSYRRTASEKEAVLTSR